MGYGVSQFTIIFLQLGDALQIGAQSGCCQNLLLQLMEALRQLSIVFLQFPYPLGQLHELRLDLLEHALELLNSFYSLTRTVGENSVHRLKFFHRPAEKLH